MAKKKKKSNKTFIKDTSQLSSEQCFIMSIESINKSERNFYRHCIYLASAYQKLKDDEDKAETLNSWKQRLGVGCPREVERRICVGKRFSHLKSDHMVALGRSKLKILAKLPKEAEGVLITLIEHSDKLSCSDLDLIIKNIPREILKKKKTEISSKINSLIKETKLKTKDAL